MDKLQIWTDGSYRPSVDVGGIGVAVVAEDEVIHKISRRYEHTTNNQMEILAIMFALDYLIKNPVKEAIIYSDSQYCLGIITKNWKRNKNVELWMKFDKIKKQARAVCGSIKFQFTKGHDSDMYNNLADELATQASGYR